MSGGKVSTILVLVTRCNLISLKEMMADQHGFGVGTRRRQEVSSEKNEAYHGMDSSVRGLQSSFKSRTHRKDE